MSTENSLLLQTKLLYEAINIMNDSKTSLNESAGIEVLNEAFTETVKKFCDKLKEFIKKIIEKIKDFLIKVKRKITTKINIKKYGNTDSFAIGYLKDGKLYDVSSKNIPDIYHKYYDVNIIYETDIDKINTEYDKFKNELNASIEQFKEFPNKEITNFISLNSLRWVEDFENRLDKAFGYSGTAIERAINEMKHALEFYNNIRASDIIRLYDDTDMTFEKKVATLNKIAIEYAEYANMVITKLSLISNNTFLYVKNSKGEFRHIYDSDTD